MIGQLQTVILISVIFSLKMTLCLAGKAANLCFCRKPSQQVKDLQSIKIEIRVESEFGPIV